MPLGCFHRLKAHEYIHVAMRQRSRFGRCLRLNCKLTAAKFAEARFLVGCLTFWVGDKCGLIGWIQQLAYVQSKASYKKPNWLGRQIKPRTASKMIPVEKHCSEPQNHNNFKIVHKLKRVNVLLQNSGMRNNYIFISISRHLLYRAVIELHLLVTKFELSTESIT